MHLALYRKYRPSVFRDMCGQEHVTSVLKYEVANERLSHAYLFCGSRGTGKTSAAKILAKAANCLSPVDGEPCGECEACRAIDSGIATDVVEMDAASNNGVDYIRELRDEVTYPPVMLRRRVYIIDEVHMLSGSAFNALLKTLEEPPEHVLFILATTEMHKLPVTIVSRCQRFDFRRIGVGEIVSRLKYISDCENISLTDDAAARIAKAAEGGMRDAISLLELCAGGGASVDDEKAQKILGQTGYDAVAAVAHAVAKRDISSIFAAVKTVVESSKDVSVFWQELISFWKDMLVSKYTTDFKSYLDLTEPDAALLSGAASEFSVAALVYQLGAMDDAYRTMLQSPQTKRLNAEVTLVRLCDPSLSTTAASLTARVSALEDKVKLMEFGAAPVTPAPAPVHEEPKEKAPAETPAEAVPAPVTVTPLDGETYLDDLGAVLDKLQTSSPEAAGFITDSSVYVSADGKRVKIIPGSQFGKMMIDRPNILRAVAEALLLSGKCSALPEITVGAPQKKAPPSDPLDELI